MVTTFGAERAEFELELGQHVSVHEEGADLIGRISHN
jgi:hypothetical protein